MKKLFQNKLIMNNSCVWYSMVEIFLNCDNIREKNSFRVLHNSKDIPKASRE